MARVSMMVRCRGRNGDAIAGRRRPPPAQRRRHGLGDGQVGHALDVGSATAIPCGVPSRITSTRGALSTASRSRVSLARNSWPIPICQRVRHQHDAEQGILRLAHGQDHGQQRTQDEVEPGQDVRPQNLRDRAAGPLPAFVRQPTRPSTPVPGYRFRGRPIRRRREARDGRCRGGRSWRPGCPAR